MIPELVAAVVALVLGLAAGLLIAGRRGPPPPPGVPEKDTLATDELGRRLVHGAATEVYEETAAAAESVVPDPHEAAAEVGRVRHRIAAPVLLEAE